MGWLKKFVASKKKKLKEKLKEKLKSRLEMESWHETCNILECVYL